MIRTYMCWSVAGDGDLAKRYIHEAPGSPACKVASAVQFLVARALLPLIASGR